GLINPLDPDSDGDGIFDGTEAGKGCSEGDTDADAGQCIPDADEGETTTGVLDPATDKGRGPDGEEDTTRNGAVDPGERGPLDPTGGVVVPAPGEGGAGGGGAGGGAGDAGAGEGGDSGGTATGGSGGTTAGTGGTDQGGTAGSAGSGAGARAG